MSAWQLSRDSDGEKWLETKWGDQGEPLIVKLKLEQRAGGEGIGEVGIIWGRARQAKAIATAKTQSQEVPSVAGEQRGAQCGWCREMMMGKV